MSHVFCPFLTGFVWKLSGRKGRRIPNHIISQGGEDKTWSRFGGADVMSTAADMFSVKVQRHPGRAEDDNSGLEVSAPLLK